MTTKELFAGPWSWKHHLEGPFSLVSLLRTYSAWPRVGKNRRVPLKAGSGRESLPPQQETASFLGGKLVSHAPLFSVFRTPSFSLLPIQL